MSRTRHRRSRKVGLPAGTLLHMGEIKTQHTRLSLFRNENQQWQEDTVTTLQSLAPPSSGTLWLNVHGLHDTVLIEQVGRAFNLHPLALEDILNTSQRPKMDTYPDYLFIITRFFSYDRNNMAISSEQVSIILGRNFVLTFQEQPTGSFEPVRDRLRSNSVPRSAGADHLAYALLDIIIDRYFIVLEQIGDDSDRLEEELLRGSGAPVLQGIHKLRRETMDLRRAVWPLREIINSLVRNEGGFFEAGTLLYLRDIYDHTVHFIESLEAIRDLLAAMLDIYLSSVSNRVNMEVRALTVVAMLFMPATLVAGIFGMNFRVMPWLEESNGFWFAIGLMCGIAGLMGLIFWRRQWLIRK